MQTHLECLIRKNLVILGRKTQVLYLSTGKRNHVATCTQKPLLIRQMAVPLSVTPHCYGMHVCVCKGTFKRTGPLSVECATSLFSFIRWNARPRWCVYVCVRNRANAPHFHPPHTLSTRE